MAVTIGVARETAPGERRVALTPETCRKLVAAGATVLVERGLGDLAHFPDAAYADAGAQLVADAAAATANADIVPCVQPPSVAAIGRLRDGAVLIGMLHPQADPARAEALLARGIVAFPLERLPRTTRAQSMDVLSSQAGMAGYKAMLLAAQLAPRFFPMLTTAAGTIRPSKVLVVGAGVAGLQAIATARRLGAQVEGFDVRPETREQIESLGGRFLDLGVSAAGEGGYARALTDDERAEQQRRLAEHVRNIDAIVCTAAVPGRPAARTLERQPDRARTHLPPCRTLAVDDSGTAQERAPRPAPLGTHGSRTPRGNEGAVPGDEADVARTAQGTAQALARDDAGTAPPVGRGEPRQAALN